MDTKWLVCGGSEIFPAVRFAVRQRVELFIWFIIFRFIEIVDGELDVNREMATYVEENLFTINIDEIAAEINNVIIKTKYISS